jgi:tetratricopeptide (TPR) repeat protein
MLARIPTPLALPLLLALAGLMAAPWAHAQPFVPANDADVVETLRDRPLERTDVELRRLRAALRRDPTELSLALAVAQRCIQVARRDGDPRYIGYAQAALAPWWRQPDAPPQVRLLKAIVLQSVHEFGPAVHELDEILARAPTNSQAWLTRASIFQAQGRYDEAVADCGRLLDLGASVYAQACLAELQGLRGQASQAYERLEQLRAAHPEETAWLSLIEAELAERRGDAVDAEAHFRAALAANPDAYTRAAYADFLLDHARAREVIELLRGSERADPLLLRLALAYQENGDARLAGAVQALQERFDAAHLRGDTVHQREEARFALELLHQPDRALALALANWQVQREPADARILLAAAHAAGRDGAADPVRRFLAANGLPDVRLAAFVQ